MKLRFLIVCDTFGQKSDPVLQYWDVEEGIWKAVGTVECKTWDEEACNLDEEATESYGMFWQRHERGK